MPDNPATRALTRAVNKARAEGAPVYVNQPVAAPPMTQQQMYLAAERRCADANEAMLDLLFGPNPISDDELSALIAKRPATYGRFAGYIGKRNAR
ncbi:MAG: hypothetical protein H0T76_20280 [Nannocystis sp.]|nr:hypothetical protein [Nannocystis sp.]MBA3548827.1 hypothetical protein [Nannocystis sp.]